MYAQASAETRAHNARKLELTEANVHLFGPGYSFYHRHPETIKAYSSTPVYNGDKEQARKALTAITPTSRSLHYAIRQTWHEYPQHKIEEYTALATKYLKEKFFSVLSVHDSKEFLRLAKQGKAVSTQFSGYSSDDYRPLIFQAGEKLHLYLVKADVTYPEEEQLKKFDPFAEQAHWKALFESNNGQKLQGGGKDKSELPEIINRKEVGESLLQKVKAAHEELPSYVKQISQELTKLLEDELESLEYFLTETRICEFVYKSAEATTKYYSYEATQQRYERLVRDFKRRLLASLCLLTFYAAIHAVHGYTRCAIHISKLCKEMLAEVNQLHQTYKALSKEPTIAEVKELLLDRYYANEEQLEMEREAFAAIYEHCSPEVQERLKPGTKDANAEMNSINQRVRSIVELLVAHIEDTTASCLNITTSYLKRLGKASNLYAINSGYWHSDKTPSERFKETNTVIANIVKYAQRQCVESNLLVVTDTFFLNTLDGSLAIALFIDAADYRVIDIGFDFSENTNLYLNGLKRIQRKYGDTGFNFLLSDQSSSATSSSMSEYLWEHGVLPSLTAPGNPELNHVAEKCNGTFRLEFFATAGIPYDQMSIDDVLNALTDFMLWYNMMRLREDTTKKRTDLPEVSRFEPPYVLHKASLARQKAGMKKLGFPMPSNGLSGTGFTVSFHKIWFHRADYDPATINKLIPYAAVANLTHSDYLYQQANSLRKPGNRWLAYQHATKYVEYGILDEDDRAKLKACLTKVKGVFKGLKSSKKRKPTDQDQETLFEVNETVISMLAEHDVKMMKGAGIDDQVAGRTSFTFLYNNHLYTDLYDLLHAMYEQHDPTYNKDRAGPEELKKHLLKQVRYQKNPGLLDRCIFDTEWSEPLSNESESDALCNQKAYDSTVRSGAIVPKATLSKPALDAKEPAVEEPNKSTRVRESSKVKRLVKNVEDRVKALEKLCNDIEEMTPDTCVDFNRYNNAKVKP